MINKFKMAAVIELVKTLITEFKTSDQTQLDLDQAYNRKERQEIHTFVETLALHSKSHTKPGTNIRLMTIQKVPFDNSMEITPDIIDIFLKYTGYSVPNTEYFSYYLTILDLYLPASQTWEAFLDDFEKSFQSNISVLKQEVVRITREIKSFFDKSVEIAEFKSRMENLKGGKLASLYNHTRQDGLFVSIDIRKANYTILKMKTGDLLKGLEWKDFLGQYTKSKFLLESKYFREHIFGDCKITDRTVKLSHQHLFEIQKDLLEKVDGLNLKDVVYQKGDEIVYQLTNAHSQNLKILRDLQESLVDHPELKLTYFKLHQLQSQDFYAKEFFDLETAKPTSCEFKKVPNIFLMQAIKFWFKQPSQVEDFKFIHQGLLATYDQPIFDDSK